MGALALLLGALLALVPAAYAHAPEAAGVSAGQVMSQWSFEPLVVSLLLASGALYALGVARLWRHAGRGRGVSVLQAWAFVAGWLSLVVALVSPLDALGARLFSAHMVQHEILMLIAAPLLVLGRPLAAWAWALPQRQARAIGGFFHSRAWSGFWSVLTDPLAAWSLHAIALWAWHVPSFFEAALRDEGWHTLQHASFLGTALLFWWAMLGADARARQRSGMALVYLFTTMLHTGALGALLTLAPTPWYPDYAATAGSLGFDPVEDQQLGGLVMWVPGSVAYLVAGLWLVARLLNRKLANPAMPDAPGLPRSNAP
jgi:putative membrane protein